MATLKFHKDSIYEDEIWVVRYDDSTGYEEKYLELVKAELEKSNFPQLIISIDEYQTGGFFGRKELTKMLRIYVQESHLSGFNIYFRAQVFGNVLVYSRYECIGGGFFTSGLSGKERAAMIRAKCNNLAQYEEFIALDGLADIVYDSVLAQLDPAFEERRKLKP